MRAANQGAVSVAASVRCLVLGRLARHRHLNPIIVDQGSIDRNTDKYQGDCGGEAQRSRARHCFHRARSVGFAGQAAKSHSVLCKQWSSLAPSSSPILVRRCKMSRHERDLSPLPV